jgi:hypothetical protein
MTSEYDDLAEVVDEALSDPDHYDPYSKYVFRGKDGYWYFCRRGVTGHGPYNTRGEAIDALLGYEP